MSFNKGNKYEIRHRALFEAIRFCGGVTAYSKRLNISRSRASNWCNQPEIEIPYEHVVLTEDITQVSIERLSPFTEAANKIIRRLRTQNTPPPITMEIEAILIGDYPYLKWLKQDRPILVGTDGILISGLMQIEIHKVSGIKKARVTVLDLEAILLEKRSIGDLNINLLISEQIAIGLRLEQLLGNHPGQRNDLHKHENFINSNNPQPRRICDEVVNDKGSKIAKLVGLPSRDAYYRARQVYLHGNSELINMLDEKQISIALAAKKINSKKFLFKQSKETIDYDAEN